MPQSTKLSPSRTPSASPIAAPGVVYRKSPKQTHRENSSLCSAACLPSPFHGAGMYLQKLYASVLRTLCCAKSSAPLTRLEIYQKYEQELRSVSRTFAAKNKLNSETKKLSVWWKRTYFHFPKRIQRLLLLEDVIDRHTGDPSNAHEWAEKNYARYEHLAEAFVVNLSMERSGGEVLDPRKTVPNLLIRLADYLSSEIAKMKAAQ